MSFTAKVPFWGHPHVLARVLGHSHPLETLCLPPRTQEALMPWTGPPLGDCMQLWAPEFKERERRLEQKRAPGITRGLEHLPQDETTSWSMEQASAGRRSFQGEQPEHAHAPMAPAVLAEHAERHRLSQRLRQVAESTGTATAMCTFCTARWWQEPSHSQREGSRSRRRPQT